MFDVVVMVDAFIDAHILQATCSSREKCIQVYSLSTSVHVSFNSATRILLTSWSDLFVIIIIQMATIDCLGKGIKMPL